MYERREHRRIRLRRKVGIVQSTGEVVYVWTFDLSLGGMQIRTDYSADVGATFDAFMGVFDPSNQEHVIVEMRVQVVHLVYDGTAGCYRIGMRFVDFMRNGDAFERFVEARADAWRPDD